MVLKDILITLTAAMCAVVTTVSFAQESPKETTKVTMKAVGSLAFSFHPGSESVFLNFGGPQIRLDYDKIGISYGMFPSLRFFYGDINDNTNLNRTKPLATPILGTGMSLYYRKLAIVLPMYYLPVNNVWLVSVGAGYKF